MTDRLKFLNHKIWLHILWYVLQTYKKRASEVHKFASPELLSSTSHMTNESTIKRFETVIRNRIKSTSSKKYK